MKVVKESPTDKQKNDAKLQNKRVENKMERYKEIILLLEIRKKYFLKLSNFKPFPLWLKAKYRLKVYDLESEILSKSDYLKIYNERIINVKYAENVIKPENEK